MKNINESFDDIPEKYRSSDEDEQFISEFENFEEYCMMSGKSSIFRNTVSDFLKNEGISPSEISWSGDYPEKLGIDKAKEMLKVVKDAVYGNPVNEGCGKKSKKRNSLKEGITDYIPRGGLFRNSEDKPIGAYFGQGTKDQLKKAKIIARVKAYEAEPGKKFMAGRVSSDDLKNYDEYARKYEEYFGEIVDEGFNKKSLKESLEDFESENPEIEAFIEEEPTNNPEDCVSMNIPLLMRVLEFAKEDASSDEQLHDVVERMIEMSKNGQILSMDDYDSIIESAPVNEEPAIETDEETVYDAESPFDEVEDDYSDNTMSDEEWLRSYGW